MKKKLLIAVLLLAVTFLGVETSKVLAENGPYPGSAGIAFYNPEDNTEYSIFSAGIVNNDAFEGTTYDKDSNTLTLDNVKTTLSLEYAGMGDDFKINLVGDNEIGFLSSYTYGYGSNINFVGNGSLTINKNKDKESGIFFASSGVKGKIEVADTATLKVYGSKFVIGVEYSKESDGSKVFVFKNGQDISDSIKSKEIIEKQPQQMEVLVFNDAGSTNYTVATKDGKKYAVSRLSGGSYVVQNNVLAYDEANEFYFLDPTSNPTGSGVNPQYSTLEELSAAGYKMTDEQITVNYWADCGPRPLAVDEKGTRYLYSTNYYNGNVNYYVYDITEDTIKLFDGKNYTVAMINDEVSFDTLTTLEEDVSEGYEHIVNLKELEILPGSSSNANVPEVVTSSDNKSDNDKAAAKAVNVLLDAAKNGEKVIGMSAELISAINEAVENGDDVTVELDTTKMELKDVSDEVKAKVEAKIKEEKTLKDSNVLGYFDINLVVKINGDALDEKVTDLKEEMEVKLDVSELVKNLPAVASGKVRQYNVITIHNGEVKVLKGTLNADNTLSFKTNGFSSYVVTYNDVDADSVNPKTLDNIGGYISVLVLSMIGFMVTALCLKKRNN